LVENLTGRDQVVDPGGKHENVTATAINCEDVKWIEGA
jgi:hypothetical protein